MTINEFNEWLLSQPIMDKLVRVRYKYSSNVNWVYSIEYLMVDLHSEDLYAWLYDWDEGQQDIEVLGCIDVKDIDVPLFNKKTESEE